MSINKRLLTLVGLLIVIAVIGVLTAFNYLQTRNAAPFKKEVQAGKEQGSVAVFKKSWSSVAVMIDNFEESYRAAGLNQARVIYEVPVEAGITRFLTIFDLESLPEKIGPVRSTRPYFIDLASDYKGILVHAGGSPEALKQLKAENDLSYDLNEISGNGIYFWRDISRVAPFNVYTGRDLIKKAIKDKGLKINETSNFLYESKKTEGDKMDRFAGVASRQAEIEIDYREPVFWKFNKEESQYLRYKKTNDKLSSFEDEDGQIKTPNLVILKTEIKIIDEIGRRQIKLAGAGEAIILQNGETKKGIWLKSAESPLKFYDLENQEIKFLPGKIWIEIVDNFFKISL